MSDEWQHRLHPEKCAEHGHPGATYNPTARKTWCLCGAAVTDGDTVAATPDCLGPAHCGGVLSECLDASQTRRPCDRA